MAKINRAHQKIFGSSAGGTQIGKFGSLAAGSIAYTTDPTVLQSLSNFDTGWYGAVVGGNSPAIQDVNALDYLWSYQLAYIFQSGVPEWNTTCVYYIGSFVSDGVGGIYYSLTDANTGNALSSTTNWRKVSGPGTVQTKTGTYQVLVGDKLIKVSGTWTLTMPNATLVDTCQEFVVKKTDSNATTITIAFLASQTADTQSTLSLTEQYSYYRLMSDGANWQIVGAG